MKRLLYIIFSLAGLFCAPRLSALNAKEASEEIYGVQYQNFEVSYVTYSKNKEIYIPIIALASDFMIYNQYDSEKKALSGYIGKPENKFRLDFDGLTGMRIGSVYSFTESDFFFEGADAYCSLSLLKKSLGLKAKVDREYLTITIESEIPLPILKFGGKKSARAGDMADGRDAGYPAIGSFGWKIIDGAMLDWNAASLINSQSSIYSGGGALGMQAFGGDLILRGYASRDVKRGLSQSLFSGTWRYFVGENPWLTQVSLGELNSYGRISATEIPIRRINGFQATNEIYKTPIFFSNRIIEDVVKPGWIVELYKNGQIIDQAVADSTGKVSFLVPIGYGGNAIELRRYGTRGEYDTRDFRLDVSAEQLRPGELKYLLNYGDDLVSGDRAGEARLSVGINSWLTNSIFASNVFKQKSSGIFSPEKKLDLIDVVSFMSFTGASFRFIYSHDKFISAYLRANLTKTIYAEFKHTVNEKNYGGFNYRTELRASIPNISVLPIGLNLWADRYYSNSSANTSVNINSYLYSYPFNFAVNYYALLNETAAGVRIGNQILSGEASCSLFEGSKFLNGALSDIRVGARISASFSRTNVYDWGAFLSKQFSQKLYFTINAATGGYGGGLSCNLQLNAYLPYFNSQTGSSFGGGGGAFSQQLSGSVGFDPKNFQLEPASNSFGGYAGRGAANFRFFMDTNGNGKYDEGENTVPDANVNLSSFGANSVRSGDFIRVLNLNPYERINVTVDESAMQNPNIIALKKEFSFIADPNVYQEINIPCVMGGVIEGGVAFERAPGIVTGQSGVRLYLKNLETGETETLNVFNDGSFYKIGVAPGKYSLYVDSTQLDLLRAKSEPVEFTVKNSIDGDYVSGLSIKLRPAEIKTQLAPVSK